MGVLKSLFSNRAASPQVRLEQILKKLNEDWSLATFSELEALAEGGLVAARFELGRIYERGDGVLQNLDDAIKLYELAALDGDVRAQSRLGLLYLEKDQVFTSAEGELVYVFNPHKAAEWNSRAAAQGDVEGSLRLAHQFASGEGCIRDYDRARLILAELAEAGIISATALLGRLLAGGYGDIPDDAAAIPWLREATRCGENGGTYWLGVALLRSTERSKREEGFRFLAQIAAGRDVAAMYQVGMALWAGNGTRRDLDASETWLRRAAVSGDVDASRGLAQLILEAREPQVDEAVHLLRRNVNLGDKRSSSLLAELLLTGHGVRRDPTEAAKLLTMAGEFARPAAWGALAAAATDLDAANVSKFTETLVWAAEHGSIEAKFVLGTKYFAGHRVGEDLALAVKWLTEASAAGEARSAYYLALSFERKAEFTIDRAVLECLEVAERRGYAKATVKISAILMNSGVLRREQSAIRRLARQAEKGNPVACLAVGKLIEETQGYSDAAHDMYLRALWMGSVGAAAKLSTAFDRLANEDRRLTINVLVEALNTSNVFADPLSRGAVHFHLSNVIKEIPGWNFERQSVRIRGREVRAIDLLEFAAALGYLPALRALTRLRAPRLLDPFNDINTDEGGGDLKTSIGSIVGLWLKFGENFSGERNRILGLAYANTVNNAKLATRHLRRAARAGDKVAQEWLSVAESSDFNQAR